MRRVQRAASRVATFVVIGAVFAATGVGCGLIAGLDTLSGDGLGEGGSGLASSSMNAGGAGPGSGGGGTGGASTSSGPASSSSGSMSNSSSSSSSSSGSGGAPPCFECFEPEWTQSLSGAFDQLVNDVALDPQGNVIVVGTVEGKADFKGTCPMPPSGVCPMMSKGDRDVFIAKLDPAGKPIWSNSFGSADFQEALSVAVDSDGAMIVAGKFRGTINFGGLDLTSANDANDAFVAKFASNGTHIWSAGYGNVGEDLAEGIAVDSEGNIIVVGRFATAIDFGDGGFSSQGSNDAFVAKLKPGGTLDWSDRFGDSGDQRALVAAVDPMNNIIVGGRFTGSMVFGMNTLQAGSVADVFVAKLGADGAPSWSQMFGDSSSVQEVTNVAAAADGSVLIAGQFAGSVDFKGGVGDGPKLTADATDTFIAKLDPVTGAVTWSRRFGASNDQSSAGLAIGTGGDVFVTGRMSNADPIFFAGKNLSSAGSYDAYVLHFDANGKPLCGTRFGDGLEQAGRGVVINDAGEITVVTNHWSTMDLGCMLSATSAGANDVLITRFKP